MKFIQRNLSEHQLMISMVVLNDNKKEIDDTLDPFYDRFHKSLGEID